MPPTPPEHLDTDFNRERDADMFQVVYLVKRSGYELAFSIPTTHPDYLSGAQAFAQIRFWDRRQGEALVLELKVLEDFYESLSRLMDYVHMEQQRDLRAYQAGQQNDVPPIRE